MIVVVNKMDEQTVKWNKARYDTIKKRLFPFLKGCGYKVKRDVKFLPISAFSGDNVCKRIETTNANKWTKDENEGKSMLDLLNETEILGRDEKAPLRIPILNCGSDRGIVASGKVESGILRPGNVLYLSPSHVETEIEEISINEKVVNCAKPGENVHLRLKNITEQDITKGFVLSDEVIRSRRLVATIKIIELLTQESLFTSGYTAVLHVHTAQSEVKIEKILYGHDPKTAKPVKGKKKVFALQGELLTVAIQISNEIAVETFKKNPVLGRITLRDKGKTIAIGKIIKLLPQKKST